MPAKDSRDEPLLTTKQAARYLNFSPKTLEGWRYRGGGPPFIRCTPRACRYRKSDLDAWILAQRRVSTSDPGPGEAR